MNFKPAVVVLIVVLLTGLPMQADEPGREPETGSDTSFAFITGTWTGGDSADAIEEIWSPSSSGLMLGMFRMLSDGEPRFYELMSIERAGDGWAMYLRHFSPGLQAWEEKDGALIFDLTEISENRALFDQRDAETNLIYEREGDELSVTLEKFVDGEWKRTPFRYRLVK